MSQQISTTLWHYHTVRAPIKACSLDEADLRRLFDIMNERQFEIAKEIEPLLSKLQTETDEQFEARRTNVRNAFVTLVSIYNSDGQRERYRKRFAALGLIEPLGSVFFRPLLVKAAGIISGVVGILIAYIALNSSALEFAHMNSRSPIFLKYFVFALISTQPYLWLIVLFGICVLMIRAFLHEELTDDGAALRGLVHQILGRRESKQKMESSLEAEEQRQRTGESQASAAT